MYKDILNLSDLDPFFISFNRIRTTEKTGASKVKKRPLLCLTSLRPCVQLSMISTPVLTYFLECKLKFYLKNFEKIIQIRYILILI